MTSDKDKFITGQIAEDMTFTARKNSKAWEMFKAVADNVDSWPTGKLNRWIGYGQCLLVAEGEITLDECIRKTREITNAADDKFD